MHIHRDTPNAKVSGSPIRSLSNTHFELLLVLMLLAGTLIVHNLVQNKHLMLHFYYVPVVIAAHYFGRALAGTTALLSFLIVSIFAIMHPGAYMETIRSPAILGLILLAWGGFLGVNAILFGTLCDQRAAQLKELQDAHRGLIEILSKYLQAADQYTKSHSQRVADLSEEIATEMNLRQAEIENIRVGALLHDIGKVEVSTRLIQKAADLTDVERSEVAAHTFRGAELVRSLGTILEGAIPVILHHHDHYSAESKAEGLHGKSIPLGARVVAVADAYDAIVTDRPYRRGRTPQEAIAAIGECAGKQFDPDVVKAFERVIVNRVDEEDVPVGGRPAAAEYDHDDAILNVEIPPPAREKADSHSV